MKSIVALAFVGAALLGSANYFNSPNPSEERLAGFDASGIGANVIEMPFSVIVGIPWNTGQWSPFFEVPDSGTSYRPSTSQVRVIGHARASNVNRPFLRVVNATGVQLWEGEMSINEQTILELPRMFSGDRIEVQHFGGSGGTNVFTVEGVLLTDSPPARK